VDTRICTRLVRRTRVHADADDAGKEDVDNVVIVELDPERFQRTE
jgi:hypothetical protein